MSEPPVPDAVVPDAVIYDWDNTLVDGWAAIAAALNVVFAAYDMPAWSAADARASVRHSMADSFAQMFGTSWREAAKLFRENFARLHLDHLVAMPGVDEALCAGAVWPQGVVSNKDGAFLRREVAHMGWSPRFASVVGAGDAAADKPRPEPIWMALSALGVKPTPRVWYVGDTALDMHAARAAGCTAVLLGDGGHDGGVAAFQERGSVPDLCFADGLALAAQLRALAGRHSHLILDASPGRATPGVASGLTANQDKEEGSCCGH